MSKKKRIPLRKCVGCQEKQEKKALVRIVRTPEGKILHDKGGKMAGRGSYICPKSSCLEKALKNKGIERALGGKIESELAEQLKETLPEKEDGTRG